MRRKRIIKKIIDDGVDDRSKAQEAYEFFRTLVETNPADPDSKRCMVACLKLMQTSKVQTIKLIAMVLRGTVEPKKLGNEEIPDFNDLLRDAAQVDD